MKKNSSKGRLMLILLNVDIDKSINFIFKNTLDLMRNGISKECYVLETPLIIELADLHFTTFHSSSENYATFNRSILIYNLAIERSPGFGSNKSNYTQHYLYKRY